MKSFILLKILKRIWYKKSIENQLKMIRACKPYFGLQALDYTIIVVHRFEHNLFFSHRVP